MIFELKVLFLILGVHLLSSLMFWFLWNQQVVLSENILAALKSPKNRSQIEKNITDMQLEKKMSIFWPFFLLKKFTNELRKRK